MCYKCFLFELFKLFRLFPTAPNSASVLPSRHGIAKNTYFTTCFWRNKDILKIWNILLRNTISLKEQWQLSDWSYDSHSWKNFVSTQNKISIIFLRALCKNWCKQTHVSEFASLFNAWVFGIDSIHIYLYTVPSHVFFWVIADHKSIIAENCQLWLTS